MQFDEDLKFVGYFTNVPGPVYGNFWHAVVTVDPCGELWENRPECEKLRLEPQVSEEFYMNIEIVEPGVTFINVGDTPILANISSDNLADRYFYKAECEDPSDCRKVKSENFKLKLPWDKK